MNNDRDENAAGDDCGARERKWENDDHLRTFGAFTQLAVRYPLNAGLIISIPCFIDLS